MIAITSVITTLGTYLVRRRNTSGRVATTEATVLWSQTQNLIAVLQAEKATAIDQRDKLMSAMTNQIHPALTAISISQQETTQFMERILALVDDLARRSDSHVSQSLPPN